MATRTRFEDADTEEQSGGGETVVEHLEQSAAQCGRRGLGVQTAGARHREEREQAIAQVVDRGVGDHPFEVGLFHRGKGAEYHATQREPDEPGRGSVQLHGKKRPQDPQETIDAHLGHDAREKHRGAGRGFRVGRRQPGVKREERHLDRQPKQHAEENRGQDRAAHLGRESAAMGEGRQFHKVKGADCRK